MVEGSSAWKQQLSPRAVDCGPVARNLSAWEGADGELPCLSGVYGTVHVLARCWRTGVVMVSEAYDS
jgi:hypothetical protein